MSIFELFDDAYGGGMYTSIPDGTGGIDIVHDGTVTDHLSSDGTFQSQDDGLIVPNIEGGLDIIVDGKVDSHTQPNIFGGVDVYEDNELSSTSIPNVEGGVNIFNSDFDFEGMTMPNVFGGEDYIANESNLDEIMTYPDPLMHSSEYKMDALVF